MLSKLMKYELKSMMRKFSVIWLGLLAAAALRGLIGFLDKESRLLGFLPSDLLTLVYGALMVAMVVLSIIFVLQRFYNGLLKEEGYLMFTLPVKTSQLVTSKLLTAMIVTIISILVGILSIFCLAPDLLKEIIQGWDGLTQMLTEEVPHWRLLTVEVLILFIVSGLSRILHIYASMALGHLGSKHRIALSVAAYIGLSVVMTVLATGLMHFFKFAAAYDSFLSMIESMPSFGAVQLFLGLMLVICVVPGAAFYIITERILAKRLNLE